MKNLSRILLITILISTNVLAQGQRTPNQRQERIDAMKIGFITNKLNLTSEEAKVFWPIYNQYSDELEKLQKDRRQNLMNARDNFDTMKDAEVEKAVDNEINFRSNEVDLIKKYYPQFKKVLPIKKVAQLYKAEEEFKRKLLEMLRDKRGQRQERMNDVR